MEKKTSAATANRVARTIEYAERQPIDLLNIIVCLPLRRRKAGTPSCRLSHYDGLAM
jgi:hypothetical protein